MKKVEEKSNGCVSEKVKTHTMKNLAAEMGHKNENALNFRKCYIFYLFFVQMHLAMFKCS